MNWVIRTIVDVILGALCEVFANLSMDFITSFGINIGASGFPAINSVDNNEYGSSLATILSEYPNTSGTASVFDKLFPLADYKTLFLGMAITIAATLFILEITKVLANPITGGRKQHPMSSVAKFAGAVVGAALSYRIFIILEYIANSFYVKFAKVAITGMQPDSEGGDAVATMTEKISQNFSTGFFTGTDLAMSILSLAVLWLMLVNFIKLLIEIIERYVVLGLLFYSAPLPFATLVSEDTRDIFTSWVRMVVSEMILIVTNSLFLGVFIKALTNISPVGDGGSTKAEEASGLISGGGAAVYSLDALSWCIYMFMMIAWLMMAQRFDAYLKGLGLSTAQTGGGLAGAVMAGAATVMSVGKSASRIASKTPKGQEIARARASGGIAAGMSARVAALTPGPKGMQKASAVANRASAMNQLTKDGQSALGSAMFGGGKLSGDAARKTVASMASATGLPPATRNAIASAADVKTDGKGGALLSYGDGSSKTLRFDGIGSPGASSKIGTFAGNNISMTDNGSFLAGDGNAAHPSEAVLHSQAILGANINNPDSIGHQKATAYMQSLNDAMGGQASYTVDTSPADGCSWIKSSEEGVLGAVVPTASANMIDGDATNLGGGFSFVETNNLSPSDNQSFLFYGEEDNSLKDNYLESVASVPEEPQVDHTPKARPENNYYDENINDYYDKNIEDKYL